ncbi:transcriptional regulator [Streptomyces paromomycinus]|uniref:Transcriptional regulator n=1 Tax=Streptomyces paromomycinus TaxID=92743 RepID=A0A401VVE9_STREY|nr:transcriptional regulator [Streptomyces paromomycinus]
MTHGSWSSVCPAVRGRIRCPYRRWSVRRGPGAKEERPWECRFPPGGWSGGDDPRSGHDTGAHRVSADSARVPGPARVRSAVASTVPGPGITPRRGRRTGRDQHRLRRATGTGQRAAAFGERGGSAAASAAPGPRRTHLPLRPGPAAPAQCAAVAAQRDVAAPDASEDVRFLRRPRTRRTGRAAHLRAAWTAHPEDQELADRVTDFAVCNEEFARFWDEWDVKANGRGPKVLWPPDVGVIVVHVEVLMPLQVPYRRSVIFRAVDDESRSEPGVRPC